MPLTPVASAIRQIPGPVLAVGHSYGGAIITNAAPQAGNVVGLVYVAAFAPDEGEALSDIEAGSTDSVLNTALLQLQSTTNLSSSAFWTPVQQTPVTTGNVTTVQVPIGGAAQSFRLVASP